MRSEGFATFRKVKPTLVCIETSSNGGPTNFHKLRDVTRQRKIDVA